MLNISVDDILRGQGADPLVVHARKPLLIAAAERARIGGFNLIHPAALTQEIAVHAHLHDRILLEGGAQMTGTLITHQLGGSQRVVAAVCTIGAELEESVNKLLSKDPLFALALDGLGNAAVESLAQQICMSIGKQAQILGLQTSMPLSPGNREWPVEVGQSQIFALLNPTRTNISLTSGGMMIPKKSVSFVVGIGPEMSQVGICDVCSLKNSCRYRHAFNLQK